MFVNKFEKIQSATRDLELNFRKDQMKMKSCSKLSSNTICKRNFSNMSLRSSAIDSNFTDSPNKRILKSICAQSSKYSLTQNYKS